MTKQKRKSNHKKSISSGQKKAGEVKKNENRISEFNKKYLNIEIDDDSINKNGDAKVTSPYNFIEISKNAVIRYKSFEELPSFEKFHKNLNTGYIDYEFTNETELFVGGKKDGLESINLFKNANGRYSIPGSTMKGVFRKNTEILGFGYPEFIENRTFMYRNFAEGDISRNEYEKVVGKKAKNIQAGYIYKDNGVYKLKPASKIRKKSWISISEKKLMQILEGECKNINFMYDESLLEEIKDKEVWKKYCEEHAPEDYKPYVQEISFDMEKNKITKISTDKNLEYKGIILNTNYIQEKSKHYIIPDMDENQDEIEVNSAYILNYKADYDANTQIKNKEFYLLPEVEGIKNKTYIFYKVENNEVRYLGKSPFLRIFYDRSVRDCIKINNIGKSIDYPSAIYGYADESTKKYSLNREQNYKSRVSFTDVKVETPNIKTKKYEMILSSPKASCYKFYLKQDNVLNSKEVMTYNLKGEGKNVKKPEIRGRKFYWNKDFIEDEFMVKGVSQEEGSNISEKVKIKLNEVFEKGNKFKGRIYFENLEDDELGLLLLSIKLKDDCKENIGIAKPYGMGRINIDSVKLYLENINNKFDSLNQKYNLEDEIKYKESYLKYINNYLRQNYNKEFCKIKQIKDFYKSKKYIGEAKDFGYMDIDEFSKFKILPKVEEI